MKSATWIGAPFHLGQPCHGVTFGPSLLRKMGCLEILRNEKLIIHDLGDLPIPTLLPNEKIESTLRRTYRSLVTGVQSALKNHSIPISVGGDHSLSIASIGGALELAQDLGVIWLDAHTDINTPTTTLTGNIHGMPLAALLGLFGDRNLSFSSRYLKPENVVIIGARSIDPLEKQIIDELGIRVIKIEELKSRGASSIMDEVLKRFSHLKNIHLSFDLDSVDPVYAPATTCLVENGITPDELKKIAERVFISQKLLSLDVVEFNPIAAKSREEISNTFRVVKLFLNSALGLNKNQEDQIHGLPGFSYSYSESINQLRRNLHHE